MIVPMMKPSGSMPKYNPNSVAGRCRSSFINVDDAGDDQERPVVQPVWMTRAQNGVGKKADKAGEHGRPSRGPVLRRNEEIGDHRDGER
jgi:hypothetical protein